MAKHLMSEGTSIFPNVGRSEAKVEGNRLRINIETRICLLVVSIILITAELYAERYISGIRMDDIDIVNNDRYESLRILAGQGVNILYFNEYYAIAEVSDESLQKISPHIKLASLPLNNALYLINKIPDQELITGLSDFKILLDLGSSYLIESDLNEILLGKILPASYTKLSMDPMRFPVKTPLPDYDGAYRSDIAQMLTFVSADSIEARLYELQIFVTRHAMADNRLQVSEWISQKFADFGVADTQLQSFDYNGTQQYNVIATIPGTVYPDEYIIVGGHHDSRSMDINDYDYAPGADDNASGTVAALEMARAICQSGYQPPVSIRFVTFACEEFGLWGSKQYSQIAYNEIQNIRLMINHDMIANNTTSSERPVKVMPYDGALDYASYAMQITDQYTDLSPYYGIYNSGGTDSYPFWQKGYNVLFFNESEFSPVYHSDNDTVANLDPDYCAEVIKASLACTVFFADIPGSPEVPLALDATQITADGFTANWDIVNHADRYLLDIYTKEPSVPASDLFFSEYIEGSGNNKALEVFNGTGADVDLSDYTVMNFVSAATNPTYSLNLAGILEDGDVYVIAHTGASAEIQAASDVRSNVAWFDGDDQLALLNESTNSYVDIIGRIGEDPGMGWGIHPLTTLNRTLVRKSSITGGITSNPVSGFPTLAAEWESYPTNTITFLGSHAMFNTCYVPYGQDLEVVNPGAWTASGLDPERIYYYVVRAANDYFTSDRSNEVSVPTLADETLPVELVSFTATVTDQNRVNLVWAVQSESGMQGYYILRGPMDYIDSANLVSPIINATNSSQPHSYEFTDNELSTSGIYYYWLCSVDFAGFYAYKGPISVYFDALGETPGTSIPAVTELLAIYPNPFNPFAFIPFNISEQTDVQIRIYNSRGQCVRDFYLGARTPGHYCFVWDGNDKSGNSVRTGIYFIIMNAGNLSYQRKSVLLK